MTMEIGGYFELERNHGEEYHTSLIRLNSGRNALRYLIKLNSIKKLILPYYMCDSVTEVCEQENIDMVFYKIDESFRPILPDISAGDWLYITDYYGFFTEEELLSYKRYTNNLILDCTQSFFKKFTDSNVNAIYSCRKFFGVPDGAYLQCSADTALELERDRSAERVLHIVGRLESSAKEYYSTYREVEQSFSSMPLKGMSLLTQNVMAGIDYEHVSAVRRANYSFLKARLDKYNKINNDVNGVPFSYPLLADEGQALRSYLISQNIFVPTLWGNVIDAYPTEYPEAYFSDNICSLPIDQRYSEKEMEFICNCVISFFEEHDHGHKE